MSHESRFGFLGNAESGILPPPRNTNQMLFVPDGTQRKDIDPTIKISDLVPGDVIEFRDITELAAFEDVVAEWVDPKHKRDNWAGRPRLRNLIRPPKFNGTISNVKLIVMDNPHERLLDARERGWKLPVGTRAGRFAPDKAESMIEKLIGFTLIAEPYSTKTKDLGQIQAELWYYPLSPHIVKAGTPIKRTYFDHSTYTHVTVETGVVKKDRLSRPDPYGKGIKRVITVPKYDTEKFIALDEDSRRMGLAVFRSNLAHPISNPMRD